MRPGAARASRGSLGALLLACSLGAARADNLEEFGLGARAQGMGLAYTALASDYTAAYYNPGGLVLSRHLNLGIGFSFADYALDFSSQRGGALDDQAGRIPDLSAFTVGVSSTIPVDVPDRLAFGLALFLPTRGVVQLDAHAPSAEPEWFRYGERHDRLHLIASLGVKLTDWLSFGAGVSLFVDGDGQVELSAGLNEPVTPAYKLTLRPDAGGVVGLRLQPADWISFGLTYRSEVSFKLDFPARAVVQGIELPLTLESISLFTPHQVQLGAAVNLTPAVLVTCDLLWANWSAYRDPHLVVTSDVVAVPNRVREDFDDVVSPRLGLEVVVTDWLALRAGYAWRNAIVPDQDGTTNLVDSSKHTLTWGIGFSWGKAPEAPSDPASADDAAPAETFAEASRDMSLDLDLFFQAHVFDPRTQRKPAGDPVGDWDAEGVILNAGFMFTVRF